MGLIDETAMAKEWWATKGYDNCVVHPSFFWHAEANSVTSVWSCSKADHWRQIVQLLSWVLFSGFIKGFITGVKTVSKENCYQLKKIQHKPPALYLPKGYGRWMIDGWIVDSGYNQLLMVVTTGSLHRCIPLHVARPKMYFTHGVQSAGKIHEGIANLCESL